ncbi:GGDEF domain-containing protein [Luteibacter sp. ME-Dv--P-043b]|uniref:GGDEF domain-containing protein n=1 Tax=Luteibacter sp. ME-Dv--P-043b TaxID=3040291 RepID=UPI0025557A42|nr:GGDEF domain-containing protein [Luteibacter sp. ME-Dv--P-043b]
MLDIETLYFSSAMSRGAFLLVFIVTAMGQPKDHHLYHWIVAIVTSTLGSLLSVRFQSAPALPPLIALMIYTLFFSSLTASWSGIRLFYGRRVSLFTLPLLVIVPSLVYTIAAMTGVSQKVSLSFVYLVAALQAAMAVREIATAPDRRMLSQYVVGVAFACYFLGLIVPVVLIAFGMMPADIRTSGRISMVTDQLTSILVYFGYIAMTAERANLSLQRQAESDPLTNLPNRRGGCQVLERFQAQVSQSVPCSIVVIDIDYFKRINDSYGHDAGDAVLVELAQRLTVMAGKREKAARWGGEEFLVILPRLSIDEAEKAAERLRLSVEMEPFIIGPHRLTVTLSLGVAEMDARDPTFDAVLARADAALYRAKRDGRNRVRRSLPATE